ncbi:hypothetical protein A1Z73_RS10395 [Acinetobacter baumannii]|nr:hypothetical protein [Acinetobacter baumannii]EHU2702788.1 hypothetical protein [Acinetobacter baumannii]
MSEVKAIYLLPSLKTDQEYCCEHGCDYVTPRKNRNVYSQSWDKNGKLIEELAEYYYTCQNNHKLMIWDNSFNNYVELDPICYKEPTA